MVQDHILPKCGGNLMIVCSPPEEGIVDCFLSPLRAEKNNATMRSSAGRDKNTQ